MAPDAEAAADALPADAVWEEAMIAAAEAAAAGDAAEAARHWQEAFDLADPPDSGLAPDDPRRAASIAGLGMARLLTGNDAEAAALLNRALEAWQACEAWIARMDPGLRPRSSAQHYRVERRFGAQHAAQALDERRRTLDIGRAATLAALAALREAAGDLAGARGFYERSIALRAEAISPRAMGVAILLERLAHLHERFGDADGAESCRQRRRDGLADPVVDGVERFRRDRPAGLLDRRALLASALLLPPAANGC